MSVRRSRTYSLIVADVIAVYGSFLLALYFRLGSDGFIDQLENRNGSLKIGLATCVWLVSLYFHDLYDYRILTLRKEMALRAVQAIGVSWILLAALYYFIPNLEIGRGTALYAIVISLVLLLSIRVALHSVLDLPNMGERILIIGEGDEVNDAIHAAIDRRAAGYRIVGILTPRATVGNDSVHSFVTSHGDYLTGGKIANGNGVTNDRKSKPSNGDGPTGFIKALGTIDDLERVVSNQRIDRVVVGVRQRRGVFPADALLRLRLNGEVVIDECAAFYERVSGKVH